MPRAVYIFIQQNSTISNIFPPDRMAKNLLKWGFWNKNWEFQMKFLFLLMIYDETHHCYRHWHSIKHVSSHYLNKWGPILVSYLHYHMMYSYHGNASCVTGPLWGESIVVQRVGMWSLMFLWCYPERTVEQMIQGLCFEKWHDAHVKPLWWSLNNWYQGFLYIYICIYT